MPPRDMFKYARADTVNKIFYYVSIECQQISCRRFAWMPRAMGLSVAGEKLGSWRVT
jgi:hypothetical protein